jgi:hypothetical protein
MPELVLDAFSSNVQMSVAGALDTSPIPTIESDATAIFLVNRSHMMNVFRYQTDSVDMVDADATDLKYYVSMANWPALNPANAMMDHGASVAPIASGFAANKMMVAHDFTRHLAEHLFGTHHGVDLFNNEVALLQNLRLICGSGAVGRTWKDITDTLTAVSTTGDAASIVVDAAGNYMTNASNSDTNICRTLLRQMLLSNPERFTGLADNSAIRSLPFQVDDSISFRLTIDAAPNQHNLTGVEAIPARTYKIRLVMKSEMEAVNTAVDAAEA